jgi:AcrR family transcriptional regulator
MSADAKRPVPPALEPRERIVRAAAQLLAEGGREAVTTRAVEAAAAVQAPTIYRLFGDKNGLIDAVAERRIADYVGREAALFGEDTVTDPVEILRESFRLHVKFGCDNPALFSLIHGDPRPDRRTAALEAGEGLLREHVWGIAAAGRLKVSEQRAINLIVAAARGTVLTLIGMPEDERDPGMIEDVLAGLIATIATEPSGQPRPLEIPLAANALRATLATASVDLTPGEEAILDELLARLIA